MKKLAAISATALIASVMLVGCASEKSTASTNQSTTVAASMPVNAKCPLSGEEVDPDTTVSYKGQTVAFCCPKCRAQWNKMTDAQRDAKLAAVK